MTTFEIKLHQYLKQRLTKYEVFWLGSDITILVTEKEISESARITKDLKNYFGFKIVVACDKPANYKNRVELIARDYYIGYQITATRFKEIMEQYGRYTDQDYDFYH
jgi:hypothetical protein